MLRRLENKLLYRGNHRHLKIIDCLTVRVFFISTVNVRSKKKKRSLFCAALVAGTIDKLEQSIFAPSISMEATDFSLKLLILDAYAGE
jgi:hypothetical protein